LDAAPALKELGKVAICTEFVNEFLFEDAIREPTVEDIGTERVLLTVAATVLL
jgi:hypothetical protein